LRDMEFVNENIGYILGYEDSQGNIILKSNNGGQTRNTIFQDDHTYNNGAFRSFYFTDSLNGYIVGSYGYIAKTNDGGNSWLQQKSFTNNYLTDILLINDSSGYIIGRYGTFASFGNINTGIFEPGADDFLNAITSFPNPFNDKIEFELYCNKNGEISIELYDVNGRLIDKEKRTIKRGQQIITLPEHIFIR